MTYTLTKFHFASIQKIEYHLPCFLFPPLAVGEGVGHSVANLVVPTTIHRFFWYDTGRIFATGCPGIQGSIGPAFAPEEG